MARFTVRVELLNIEHSHPSYTELHNAMEKKGFARHLSLRDGSRLQLPFAEYSYMGAITLEGVRDLAVATVLALKTEFRVLVTESKGRLWYNLPPAKS